ncbi:MAG: hypothetical protein BECKG1743D_GA0114223_102445 [Candidatus Kentron sp. G]|nr:MAG: hypothetical protein BECKG1743D_GA0114223_102445 [Candidatus Kentron sp. G]
MRLPRALNPDENPAQFGIFFSANRLMTISRSVFHSVNSVSIFSTRFAIDSAIFASSRSFSRRRCKNS